MTSEPSQRHKDRRHLLVAGGVNALALLAGISLTVFHTLAARIYGKVVFGLYAFTLAAADILMTIGGLATDKGLTRYIASHRVAGEVDGEAAALGTGLWMIAISSTAMALVSFVFARPLATFFGQPEAAPAFRLLSPSILFTALLNMLVWATIAAKVMRYKLWVKELGFPLLLMLIALPLGSASPTLETLSLTHVAAAALSAVWIVWATAKVFRHLPLRRALFGSRLHGDMVRYCMPMALTDPLAVVVQRASALIIGPFVSSGQIAVFAAADMLSRAIGGANTAFDPVVAPILAEAVKQKDGQRLRHNLQQVSRWVTIISLPMIIFFLLFRTELLSLYGTGFESGSKTLQIFIGGRAIMAIFGLNAAVLTMSGRSMTVLVNQVVTSVVSVVACYLLSRAYGIEGAAVAWVFSTALAYGLILVENWFYERAHPFSGGMFRAVAVGLVTWVLMRQAVTYLPESVLLKLGAASAGTLVLYGGLLLLFARTEEDAELWRMLRRKKGNRE